MRNLILLLILFLGLILIFGCNPLFHIHAKGSVCAKQYMKYSTEHHLMNWGLRDGWYYAIARDCNDAMGDFTLGYSQDSSILHEGDVVHIFGRKLNEMYYYHYINGERVKFVVNVVDIEKFELK